MQYDAFTRKNQHKQWLKFQFLPEFPSFHITAQMFSALKCQDISFFSSLVFKEKEEKGASEEAGKNLSDMRILRAFNSIKIFQK